MRQRTQSKFLINYLQDNNLYEVLYVYTGKTEKLLWKKIKLFRSNREKEDERRRIAVEFPRGVAFNRGRLLAESRKIIT